MSCHEAAAFMTVWIRNDNYYFAKLIFGSLRDLEMSDLKIACNGVAYFYIWKASRAWLFNHQNFKIKISYINQTNENEHFMLYILMFVTLMFVG